MTHRVSRTITYGATGEISQSIKEIENAVNRGVRFTDLQQEQLEQVMHMLRPLATEAKTELRKRGTPSRVKKR